MTPLEIILTILIFVLGGLIILLFHRLRGLKENLERSTEIISDKNRSVFNMEREIVELKNHIIRDIEVGDIPHVPTEGDYKENFLGTTQTVWKKKKTP